MVKGADANTTTGEGTFTFFSTPSAYVFKMLNSGFGDNIVKTEFSEVPTMANGAETLSALASKDAEGNLYIALVNADRDRDRNIALQIEGTDVAGNKMTIKSWKQILLQLQIHRMSLQLCRLQKMQKLNWKGIQSSI